MRTFLTDFAGGPALELVLVLPVFVLLVVGIFSIALLLWTENSIQFAAEAAARCASIDLNHCASVNAVKDEAIAWANGVPISRGNVTVNLGTSCTAGVTGNAVAIRYSVTYFILSTNTAAEACFPAGN